MARKDARPSEGDPRRRGRKMRSFVIGGLLGASAAAATHRLRMLPRQARGRRRETPAGLAAFESAPCYRESSEKRRTEGP